MNFIKEYQKLIKALPHPALYGGRNEEVKFSDNIWHSYRSYYCFQGGRHRDSAYVYNSTSCTDCFDCDHSNGCELCYECFVAFGCYNSSYLEYCNKLTDCHFCINCRNSESLFGCAELEYKKYCIFNVQYSKEEYEKKVKQLRQLPAVNHLEELEKLRRKLPQPAMRVTKKSENSFGDYILDAKDCYFCFFTTECEDSAFLFDSQYSQECFDNYSIHMCELCYECSPLGHSYNCSFVNAGDFLTDCHYCTNCYNSQNLFGCVNLRHAKFCILNKQYSENQFWKKVREIRQELGWLGPTKPLAKENNKGGDKNV